MKNSRAIVAASAAIAGVSAFGQITLTDGNSRVDIDPTSQDGMFAWLVDGVDHLFQQWYWYRVGNVAEASIDTIGGLVITPISGNSVNIMYSNNMFRLDVTYTLIGGSPGSGTADVAEVVRVINRTQGALDFHLFEYDDFDMSFSAGDDFAVLVNSSTIMQWDVANFATVGTVPVPNHWEIGPYPTIRNKLNDGVADNLSDSGSPFGPGDATFAFQWDVVIGPGQTFLMSKDKLIQVVPEPATLVSLGGLSLLAVLRRRRK